MFERRVLVNGLHCLSFSLLGAVQQELKLHVVDSVSSFVCDDLKGGAILSSGGRGSRDRGGSGVDVRPIRWQLVEARRDGVGRKDPVVL